MCYRTNSYGPRCMCKVGQEKLKVELGRMVGVKWWIEESSAQYESSWVVRWKANSLPVSIMKEGLWRREPSQGNLWIIKSQQLTNETETFQSALTFREVGVMQRGKDKLQFISTTWKQHTRTHIHENSTKAFGSKPLIDFRLLRCHTGFHCKQPTRVERLS